MTDLTAQRPDLAAQLPVSAATDPQPPIKPVQPQVSLRPPPRALPAEAATANPPPPLGLPRAFGYNDPRRAHQVNMEAAPAAQALLDWLQEPENQRFALEVAGAEIVANAVAILTPAAVGSVVPGVGTAGGATMGVLGRVLHYAMRFGPGAMRAVGRVTGASLGAGAGSAAANALQDTPPDQAERFVHEAGRSAALGQGAGEAVIAAGGAVARGGFARVVPGAQPLYDFLHEKALAWFPSFTDSRLAALSYAPIDASLLGGLVIGSQRRKLSDAVTGEVINMADDLVTGAQKFETTYRASDTALGEFLIQATRDADGLFRLQTEARWGKLAELLQREGKANAQIVNLATARPRGFSEAAVAEIGTWRKLYPEGDPRYALLAKVEARFKNALSGGGPAGLSFGEGHAFRVLLNDRAFTVKGDRARGELAETLYKASDALSDELDRVASQVSPEFAHSWEVWNTTYRTKAEAWRTEVFKKILHEDPSVVVAAVQRATPTEIKVWKDALHRIEPKQAASTWRAVVGKEFYDTLHELTATPPGGVGGRAASAAQQVLTGADFNRALKRYDRGKWVEIFTPPGGSTSVGEATFARLEKLRDVMVAAGQRPTSGNFRLVMQSLQGGAVFGGAFVAPVTAGSILIGPWLWAKALSSPKVLQWMVEGFEYPVTGVMAARGAEAIANLNALSNAHANDNVQSIYADAARRYGKQPSTSGGQNTRTPGRPPATGPLSPEDRDTYLKMLAD